MSPPSCSPNIVPISPNNPDALTFGANSIQQSSKVTKLPTQPRTLKRSAQATLLSYLNLDDSALHPDHRGMGTVVGAQFGEDVPDLALDSLFADRELCSNLIVGIPFGDQPQDTDLRWGQGVIGGMFGKLEGGLRRKCFFPGMDATNRFQQFLVQAIF